MPNGKPDLASRLRVEKAVEMLHSGELTHLIFSGGRNANTIGKGRKTTEALAMIEHAEKYAKAIGLPARKWNFISENDSHNTKENARNSLSLVQRHNPKEVLVFTHPQHAERTRKIFHDAGYGNRAWKLKIVSVPVIAQHNYQRPFVAAFNFIVDKIEHAKRKKQMR